MVRRARVLRRQPNPKRYLALSRFVRILNDAEAVYPFVRRVTAPPFAKETPRPRGLMSVFSDREIIGLEEFPGFAQVDSLPYAEWAERQERASSITGGKTAARINREGDFPSGESGVPLLAQIAALESAFF